MVIGKVLGVLGGLILNWFPQGVIIGLIVGILVDELLLKKMVRKSKETFWMQEFSCLYLEVLASIAVSKGRITKEDILCIREHAYIPREHNPIANRILKQAKKSRKTYNYLLSEILSCCEGAEVMFEIIAQGAVSVGALQGVAGRNKVDKLFHEFGLPPVNWSQASSFKGQQKSSAQSSRKKQKAEAHNQEDDPLVTRAYGNKSPYAVLGVKKTATAAEIKKAYRSLIQKHHPDRVRAKSQSDKAVEKAEKKVAEINAAYEVLQKKKRP